MMVFGAGAALRLGLILLFLLDPYCDGRATPAFVPIVRESALLRHERDPSAQNRTMRTAGRIASNRGARRCDRSAAGTRPPRHPSIRMKKDDGDTIAYQSGLSLN